MAFTITPIAIPSSESFGTPLVVHVIKDAFKSQLETDIDEVFLNTDDFAHQVTFFPVIGDSFNLKAQYDDAYVAVDPDTGVEVMSSDPKLLVQTSKLKFIPEMGESVLVKGIRYEIIDVQPDGFGMTSLILHHDKS